MVVKMGDEKLSTNKMIGHQYAPKPGLDPEEDLHRAVEGGELDEMDASLLKELREKAIEAKTKQIKGLRDNFRGQLGVSKDAYKRDHPRGSPKMKRKLQVRFLTEYALCGNVTLAARNAGISNTTHWRWSREDDGYREAWAEAQEHAADMMEQEATRRALVGTLEPVFYKGEKVGHIRKYSDLLMIFMLKGMRPEKYRDRFEMSRTADDIAKLAKILGVTVQEVKTAMKVAEVKKELPPGPGSGPENGDPGGSGEKQPQPDVVDVEFTSDEEAETEAEADTEVETEEDDFDADERE